MYPLFHVALWLILLLSTALLSSNCVRGQRATAEALTLVALGCGSALFLSKLLTLLSR